MKNRCLLEGLQWNKNPLVEYHLLKLPRFFSEESIFTVFPDCLKFVEENGRNGESCNVYLLYTFQPLDGELVSIPPEESENEKNVSGKYLQSDRVSALISYSPSSLEWKDNSRSVFFDFLNNVTNALKESFFREISRGQCCTSSFATNASKSMVHGDAFFIDATDPASGIPLVSHRGSTIFLDFDSIERFFSFESVLVPTVSGGCRMVSHPKYGLDVYPASIVVAIPQKGEDILLSALQRLSARKLQKTV